MNPLIPAYLPPYVLAGTLAIVVTLIVGLNRALRLAQWPDPKRRQAVHTIAALLVAWALATLVSTWFGLYRGAGERIPAIPFAVLLPIAAGVVFARRGGLIARIVEAVPQPWIAGVQLYRTLGLIFVILYAQNRLPGAFALPAGVGDFIVGLLAPAVAIAYAHRTREAAAWVRAWNLFGLADLVLAVATGFLTSPSRFQTLALDAPNQLISVFPLAMIPTFLVPLSVLLHLASLKKLRQTEKAHSPGRESGVEVKNDRVPEGRHRSSQVHLQRFARGSDSLQSQAG